MDEQGSLYVADSDSTNGTMLGSKKLPPRELTRVNSGDHVRFGSVDCVACAPVEFWRAIRTRLTIGLVGPAAPPPKTGTAEGAKRPICWILGRQHAQSPRGRCPPRGRGTRRRARHVAAVAAARVGHAHVAQRSDRPALGWDQCRRRGATSCRRSARCYRLGACNQRLATGAVRGRRRGIGLEHTLQAGPISLAPPRQLGVGDIIADRYVIEEHISSGGFGAVYRASDRQIRHHQVALKLLHLPAADDAARQAALRELTLIASVSHPSVVQFKDYGWFEGRLWFAMPWYRGETLDQRFRDSARADPRSAAPLARPIFERIARGLAAMHAVGIHHHDIKPENIFVADIAGFDGGLPVLLDLGIAAQRGEGPKRADGRVRRARGGRRPRSATASSRSAAPRTCSRSRSCCATCSSPRPRRQAEGELLPLLHKRAHGADRAAVGRELRYLKPTSSAG